MKMGGTSKLDKNAMKELPAKESKELMHLLILSYLQEYLLLVLLLVVAVCFSRIFSNIRVGAHGLGVRRM